MHRCKLQLKRWLDIVLMLRIIGAGLFVPMPQPAFAAVGINTQINYQGKLSDSLGNQVSDTSRSFKFEIWSAASSGRLRNSN